MAPSASPQNTRTQFVASISNRAFLSHFETLWLNRNEYRTDSGKSDRVRAAGGLRRFRVCRALRLAVCAAVERLAGKSYSRRRRVCRGRQTRHDSLSVSVEHNRYGPAGGFILIEK